MSIKGHINSFKFWFDKIENFRPKYFIYILGINDRYLIDTFSFREHVDNLEESTKRGNIREYLESNSFFYKKGRYIKRERLIKVFSNSLHISTTRPTNSNAAVSYGAESSMQYFW